MNSCLFHSPFLLLFFLFFKKKRRDKINVIETAVSLALIAVKDQEEEEEEEGANWMMGCGRGGGGGGVSNVQKGVKWHMKVSRPRVSWLTFACLGSS